MATGCSEAGGKARRCEESCYIDGLPDDIVLSMIAPKLIAEWDMRLFMLKQVNRAWRSLLASCRGLLGPFRSKLKIWQKDAFSCLLAYDAGCKEWRAVTCPRIASRIAVQEDGFKVYSIGKTGISVLKLTGTDEQGMPKSILGSDSLAWKTLMPVGHEHWLKHMVDNPKPSKSVAIIQGRFVFGEGDRNRHVDKGIMCFHVFNIEQGKWDKIMVSKPDALDGLSCCKLKHSQRGCILLLDYEDKELLVYDVISLQERRRKFSIHVESGKNIDVQNIREVGDGSRVFARGQGKHEHLLAFASLDVLLDEGKLKFDEFVEQLNVRGDIFSLRHDHKGGCHAILRCDCMAYLWRGRYVDTHTNKQLVWEEDGVECTIWYPILL